MRHFFSFFDILFYAQQAFVFHFLIDFCIVHDNIVTFWGKILVSFTSFFKFFFAVFPYLLDDI